MASPDRLRSAMFCSSPPLLEPHPLTHQNLLNLKSLSVFMDHFGEKTPEPRTFVNPLFHGKTQKNYLLNLGVECGGPSLAVSASLTKQGKCSLRAAVSLEIADSPVLGRPEANMIERLGGHSAGVRGGSAALYLAHSFMLLFIGLERKGV